MKKRIRILIAAGVFLALIGCQFGRDDPLPTPTVVAPRATATLSSTTSPAGETPEPSTLPPEDRQLRVNLLRATVQIVALLDQKGSLQPMWTGSGTILSPDGLILTNAHVATDPDPDYRPDALGIAITGRSDETPELKYLAEVLSIDTDLDLAVIQIVSDLSGNPVDVEKLNLNYVDIGDSDDLELGDLLQILGYPGIGGETITFTEGVVSGFTREPGVDGRAFVKTDATIAGGNSGGLASDSRGALVGVPTQVGYGGAERFADCRYLADTNNDGFIDEDDNCIPVGGFINAIRPVNLAKPLIEAARLGIAPRPQSTPDTPQASPDNVRFFNFAFAPAVTEQDLPQKIVSQLPSGATDLYACWEYEGMADGVSWEARWYLDGEYQDDVSWTPAPWKGGESGTWWVSVYNEEGLTEGLYSVELYVDGKMAAAGEIKVGGEASGAAISNVVFSTGVTADDRPTEETFLLPAGSREVYAFFEYEGMVDGSTWERVWYHAGERLASKSNSWSSGSEGAYWVSLAFDEPLDPGVYRLEFSVNGELLAAANFTVAGTQSQEALGAITFAGDIDAQGNPVDPATAFPSGLQSLYYFVDFVGMQDGLRFDEKWYFDGDELFSVDLLWDQGESGTFSDNIYRKSGEPLWDGDYALELYVEGELVQQASVSVGGAEPPQRVAPQDDGLLIQGYVIDADTSRGISGALYVVFNPGVSVAAWDGSDDDIYTAAETDADGYFELADLLQRGATYSIVVWGDGYRPVTGDGLLIADEPSPLDVEIVLQRE